MYPSPEARGIVAMLCEYRLGVKSYTHITEPEYAVPEQALAGLEKDMARLEKAEPIQYVLGQAEFCGRPFAVNPSVLIPRPETEQLALTAIRELQSVPLGPKVLDLYTGSGCLAWTVALEVSDAVVKGVDISREALETADGQFGKGNRPEFIQADILGDIPQPLLAEAPFDMILANPPYIMEKEKSMMRPNVLEYEPGLALFVADDNALIHYDAAARWAKRLLAPGAPAIMEINENLGPQTAELMRSCGFRDVSLIKDCFGRERFVHLFL